MQNDNLHPHLKAPRISKWPQKNLYIQCQSLRIQTPSYTRIGFIGFQSHPKGIGLVRGNPGLLGHIWILREWFRRTSGTTNPSGTPRPQLRFGYVSLFGCHWRNIFLHTKMLPAPISGQRRSKSPTWNFLKMIFMKNLKKNIQHLGNSSDIIYIWLSNNSLKCTCNILIIPWALVRYISFRLDEGSWKSIKAELAPIQGFDWGSGNTSNDHEKFTTKLPILLVIIRIFHQDG